MKKLTTLAVLAAAAAVALPATATADKVHNVVSIHADQYHGTDEIYGSVESAKPKCERNRTIKLFHRPFNDNKGADGFQAVDSTTTDDQGEYFFEGVAQTKTLVADFPSGEYFARATKAIRGNDVCVFDDSRVIEINNFYVP